jgi:hypothetical protein
MKEYEINSQTRNIQRKDTAYTFLCKATPVAPIFCCLEDDKAGKNEEYIHTPLATKGISKRLYLKSLEHMGKQHPKCRYRPKPL